MAFVKRADIEANGNLFFEQLYGGEYAMDVLKNHSTKFSGTHETLALAAFAKFVGSASYALIQLRRGQFLGDEYHGC